MNSIRLISALLRAAFAIGLASGVRAEAPALIPVQGFLANAKGAPVQGTHRVTFSIFNAKADGSGLASWLGHPQMRFCCP